MKYFCWLTCLLSIVACHDDADSHGVLQLDLETSAVTDGAVLVTIVGGNVEAVHPANGYQVASTVDAFGTHLLFVGDIKAGSLGTIDIPASAVPERYLALVQQVAHRTNFTLLDPLRYRITLTSILGE